MSIVWVLSETSLYHNKTEALSPFEGEGANSKRGETGGAEDWWFYLSCAYVFRQLIRHSPKVQPETSQHRDDTLCWPPASCPYCVLERPLLALDVAPRALVLFSLGALVAPNPSSRKVMGGEDQRRPWGLLVDLKGLPQGERRQVSAPLGVPVREIRMVSLRAGLPLASKSSW